jgi:hypothetical protein
MKPCFGPGMSSPSEARRNRINEDFYLLLYLPVWRQAARAFLNIITTIGDMIQTGRKTYDCPCLQELLPLDTSFPLPPALSEPALGGGEVSSRGATTGGRQARIACAFLNQFVGGFFPTNLGIAFFY